MMEDLTINQQNFKSANWEDDYFKYCTISDIVADGGQVASDFANCTFENIDWYWAFFNIVNFVDCKFINCTFQGASFPDCKFVCCEFKDCKFIKDNLDVKCGFERSIAYDCKFINTEGFEAELR
jgi:uncharacterized protein YjbI with pentapeptide repeats